MYLNDFIAKYNGRGIDYDGAYGYQCMDVYNQFQKDVLQITPKGAPYAKLVWSSYDPKVWTRISNSLTFVPKAGDVAVWGNGTYGHIAVCTGSGNTWYFDSFEQNWPVGSLCHIQRHNYFNSFYGVLRPKDQAKITRPVSTGSFTVRVNKASAAVRNAPTTTAPLAGSKVLYYGQTFQSVGTVTGQSVAGNNVWYKSVFGNYVWSGGLSRI